VWIARHLCPQPSALAILDQRTQQRFAKRRITMSVNDPAQLGQLFAERVNAGDLEGLVALYEDEATFVGPDGGSASGRDAIRERLNGLLAMAPEITPTSSRVVMAGDVALMSNITPAGRQLALCDRQSRLGGSDARSSGRDCGRSINVRAAAL
jgi:ketosteroid isomerase-like protein